jgi:glycosyltransferase involved in cell wall biosynthesis
VPTPAGFAKIRRVLFSESSPNLGGQELQALQQMRALRERGIETLLACRAQSRIGDKAAEFGLDRFVIPFRNSLHLSSLTSAYGLMRCWRPDVVVSHSGHDANVCAIAARLLSPRPRLLRARTYQPGPSSAWTYNRLADKTIVPSELMRRLLLDNPAIRPERIQVLYPGIDFAQLDANVASPLAQELTVWLQQRPGPMLLHAAMLRHEKGHLFMLDVMSHLRVEFPDLRYVIAGEGEQRQAIADKIHQCRLQDCVFLAGTVTPLAPLMAKANLLVMPSLVEPLGMSQSEALGLRVPVVASRVGGIPETVSDKSTGLLVDPGNEDAWVAAITWALTHPDDMQRMAEAGRVFVRENFSMKSNIDSLLEIMAAL